MEIDAQDCQIRKITSQECEEFCIINSNFQKVEAPINYGLFYNDELVQIISFGSCRELESSCDWEIYREVTKLDSTIVNSISRLIDYFIEENCPHSILLKSASITSGLDFYTKCGFTKVEKEGDLVFELYLSDFVGYIYKTINLINGKLYVGQHKGEFTTQYIGSGTLLRKSIEKYGKDNFKVELVERVQEKSFTDYQNKLNELERKYIKEFNSLDPSKGYNILAGGQSLVAYLNEINSFSSEEFKEQCKERMVDKWANEDYRNNQMKIRSSQEWKESQSVKLSKAWTDEMKQKHSVMRKEYLKDHPITEEIKRKMVENYKKNNPNMPKIQSELKKKYFQNHPEAKELLVQRAKEAYLRNPSKYKKSEECKKKMSEKMKGRSNEKMKEIWKTDEYREKRSRGIQESWTEEKRQKAAEVAKRKWEEEKKNGISRSKEKLQSEEYRKMMSSKMKELYKNRAGGLQKENIGGQMGKTMFYQRNALKDIIQEDVDNNLYYLT